MDDIVTLMIVKMLEHGIIPYDCHDRSLEKAFDTMSPEETRTAKRKFRKLWRKALSRFRFSDPYYRNLRRSCGLGLPTHELKSHHHHSRAFIVYEYLKEKI